MKKYILLLLGILLSVQVNADDLDISLFGDDEPTPNLGRTSTPLTSLAITPPPLPEISVPLGKQEEPQTPDTAIPLLPTQEDLTEGDLTLPSPPITLPYQQATEQVADNTEQTETPPPLEEEPVIIPPHYVREFSFNGLELGMSVPYVLATLKRQGYQVVQTREDVPRFFATDYDYKCRANGVYIPEKVAQCIKDYACYEKTRYISEITAHRKNETMQLFFTSNTTQNLLYKIVYLNKGDSSLNFTTTNLAKKQLRQKEFWNAVFDKYGKPDSYSQDGSQYYWGVENDAYMTTYMMGSDYDAYMIIEDVQLSNEDYWEAEDIEIERPPKNRFNF